MAIGTARLSMSLQQLPRQVASSITSRASARILYNSRLPRTRLLSTTIAVHQAETAQPNRTPQYQTRQNQTSPASSQQSPRATNSERPVETARSLQHGLSDQLPAAPATTPDPNAEATVDWTRSFQGLSAAPFPKEVADTLLAPIPEGDIEIKPDGIVYLPEIKYRRILNRAFGPGGWGLAPRGETIVTGKSVTREYGLVAGGRLISVARGEQAYFDPEGIPTATEGCKSNALMRCCKDLGIASELWDPRFIRKFLASNSREVWVEHAVTKKKRRITLRKEDKPQYPYKETKMGP